MSAKTEAFLAKIKPGCLSLWKIYGILPSVAAGQAALESGWGTSGLSLPPYNNLFGIKGNYGGNTTTMETWEVYGGVRYTITDNFRSYPTFADSIKDYGVFLNVNSRYAAAIGLKSYESQIKAIHAAGYATDPDYSTKVIATIKANGLYSWDTEAMSDFVAEKVETPSPVVNVAQNANTSGSNTSYVTHTVKSGDTLSAIALKYGTTVSALVAMNNIANANRISVGQVLNLPTTAKAVASTATTANRTYTVKSGDALSVIAQKLGMNQSTLIAMNGIKNPNLIYVGQILKY